MPNLVFPTGTGQNSNEGIFQILGKTQTWVFHFQVSVQSVLNKICYYSRTTHHIDIKLEPITKFDKRKTATSKNLSICHIIVFFLFMGNLVLSESRISDTWSEKLKMTLILTFYLRKPENRTKTFPTQLSY